MVSVCLVVRAVCWACCPGRHVVGARGVGSRVAPAPWGALVRATHHAEGLDASRAPGALKGGQRAGRPVSVATRGIPTGGGGARVLAPAP